MYSIIIVYRERLIGEGVSLNGVFLHAAAGVGLECNIRWANDPDWPCRHCACSLCPQVSLSYNYTHTPYCHNTCTILSLTHLRVLTHTHTHTHTHSDTLFSGSNDMTIKAWNLDTFKVEVSFHAHEDPVCTLTGSETHLFSGSLKSIKV